MTDENSLNIHLEQELENPVYDIIDEAIKYTMKKQNYQKYDLVKLVMMIYDKDYSFISSTKDYRDQFKLLDEYFYKQYNHSIITFMMIKAVLDFKNTDAYDTLTSDIASLESILRTKQKLPAEDLCIFSYPIENKKYNDLMCNIEANNSMKYAMAIIYDKIKNITTN